MLYIYGNSTLLYFEMLDPVYGYFHGLMLSLALSFSWLGFFIVGNISQKTVYKIYELEGGRRLKIEYLSFYKV
jgi:hypothetical protein